MDTSLPSKSTATKAVEIPSEVCHLCSKLFKNVVLRNLHIKRFHKVAALNPKKSYVICPLCEEKTDLRNHEGLRKHLEKIHQMSIELLTLEFCSEQEYDTWKDEEKIETKYAMHRSICQKGHKILYYDCNRSDHKGYKPNYDKRKEKSGGTIKIKGVCPSRLVCKLSDEGQVLVSYWKTHAGHQEEFRSMHLSKLEEKMVVKKLQSGISSNRVLEESRKLEASNLGRMHVLTNQDIINLTKKYNIQNKGIGTNCVLDDTETCLEENSLIRQPHEKAISELIKETVVEANQVTDRVQPQSKRSLQWKNVQNLIEGLDDDNFTELMKDIQGTLRKYEEKTNKTAHKQKMEKWEYFPSNKRSKISPVKGEKKPKIVIKEAEPENIEVLSLAPFAPAPKLVFDGVKVGETAIRKLLIKNPTKQDITIFLSKKLPAELNVSYSWESCTIEKDSEVLFELIWKTTSQESSYHKITFDSTRKNFHKDVPIAFKTVLDTKPKDFKGVKRKSPQKSPTKKYYSTRPSNISSKKYSPSPKLTKTLKTTTLPHQNSQLKGKENLLKGEVNYNNYYSSVTDTVERRGTYVFKLNDSEEFNDSLESKSPDNLSKISTPLTYSRSALASHNGYDSTPDISSYFKQKPCTPLLSVIEDITTYGFEHKLKHLESCISPAEVTSKGKENNPPSFYLNTETYITSFTGFKGKENVAASPNLSTETYVKSNLSSETYVNGNLSRETYIKDTLEESNVMSPIIHRSVTPPLLNDPYITKLNYVKPNGQVLSSIEEESFRHSTPTKRRKCDLDLTANHSKVGGGLTGPKHWSRKGGSAVRISKSSSGLKLTKIDEHIKKGAISQITRRDSNILIIENPFLLAATNMIDPFITPQLYVSDEWIDKQEKDFKKWLNSLLTPPQELLSEDKVVDVAKVWQECKKREIEAAPTKEDISNKYHVNAKLNNLRKAAQNLFRSKEICDVLSKVLLAVDAGKLSIRQDRYVHLNLSIKSEIMSIILSYNPLWLRIGLETIYNEIIPLNSNSDVVGLTTFILNKLFKDPYLIRKHTSIHSPKYAADFNKFFLKKFLTLVYFLDQAKNKKLIPHNPCLFCKTSNIKDSKELLLILARELLSAVGDITKFLKFSGYVVSHVQTYIHEFDYAVNNLGVDLRDGVRLTKVMEIILMKEDLTSNLRVPAISRLQKIHNMKIVFDSLEKSSYKIMYDISPKDIVDGHREKTMSFLWQIVYKFEAPLMVKNATTIQVWFRSLPIVLKRRKLQKIKLEKEKAATKIQIWYKRQILARSLTTFAEQLQQYLTIIKIEKATIKIQSFYRMYIQKSIYIKKIVVIKEIQRFSRGWLVRNSYMNRIKSAVLIQSYIRMFKARKSYLAIKNSTKIIQLWYRSNKQTKVAVENYQQLKSVTIFIQTQFRANMLAKKQKNDYQQLKLVTINIQRRFKANKLCKIEKQNYQKIKLAAINIQNWFRSIRAMKLCRKEFLTLKQSVLNIEQRYIALTTMKKQKETYNALRKACITIQQRYRAQMAMKTARTQYLNNRSAAVVLQRRFRAKVLMENEQKYFKSLKQATVTIQSKYKAKLAMKINRSDFLKTKNAIVQIQTWYRATIEMRLRRKEYLRLKNAVIKVENRYKAQILMWQERAKYQRIKSAVIRIQRQFTALLAMRQCKNEYSKLKVAAILIQTRFRANRAMKIQRNDYLQLKNTAVVLQHRFRGNKIMLEYKNQFKTLKNAVIVIQNRYRANQMMKTTRKEYQQFLRCTIKVQILFRANQLMVRERNKYLELKKVVGNVQTRWRAKKVGEQQRKLYHTLRTSSIVIQQRWRANKLAQKHKGQYDKLRKAIIVIQQNWKAKKVREKARKDYIALKTYTKMKKSSMIIQRWYRCVLLAREERKKYLLKQKTVIEIQRFARGYLIRKKNAEYFTDEAREQRRIIKIQNESATRIQAFWKGYKTRNEIPEMKTIRRRCNKANAAAAPEKMINFRCQAALELFVTRNSTLFHIIKALKDIDYATRRFKNICITLSKFLPNQLYILLESVTRSLPEMNACIFSVNILITFNKLQETRDCSFAPEHIDNLITIMMHWCDKESQLFPSLCTLFWLFAHSPQWKRRILNLANIKQKMEKIKGLVIRKECMVKRQGGKGSSVFIIPGNYLPEPSRTPDWGLNYVNNPFAFTNSVHALCSLLRILNFDV